MEFWIAQLFAGINGICIFCGVRCKSKRDFLMLSAFGNLMGFLSMIILRAYAATVGPVALTLQSAITYFYEKAQRPQPHIMLVLYLSINLIGGLLTVYSLLTLLPVLSSALACMMISVKKMAHVRLLNAVSSIISLPYLIFSKAYVSAAVFGVLFVNAIIAILQFDLFCETKGRKEK